MGRGGQRHGRGVGAKQCAGAARRRAGRGGDGAGEGEGGRTLSTRFLTSIDTCFRFPLGKSTASLSPGAGGEASAFGGV